MALLKVPTGVLKRVVMGDSAAGRTAALLSTIAAGSSFMPGLMPRGRREQVLTTGVVAAVQHGLVINAQARHQALARLVCTWTGRVDDPEGTRAIEAGVAAATTLAGLVAYVSLPQRPQESIERAIGRTAGLRLLRVGAASLVIAAAEQIDHRYGSTSRTVRVTAPAAGVLLGTIIAAGLISRFRRSDPVVDARNEPCRDPLTGQPLHPEDGHELRTPSLATSAALGFGASVALNLVAGVEGLTARGVAAVVKRVLPGSDPYANLIGHTVTLGALSAGIGSALEYVYHHAEAGGSAIDAAYTTQPTSGCVSGGPQSAIDWTTLSREGVRFVAMSLEHEEIASVTGGSPDDMKSPIRVFAGLETSPTVGGRVDAVMEDLEKLGGFERSVICLASPTGTGYLNYVAVEALEYLTRGDCATVALQYSLRPSFLSLDRVAMAREQNFALLHAIVWRIRGLPEGERPRLVGFGESLGAQTLQNCFVHEGVAGFERVDMDAALFLGTPAASRWARDWRDNPDAMDPQGQAAEVASYAEWLDVARRRGTRPRYVLLTNPEDPIPKFTPRLTVQRPDWLGPRAERPAGVPKYTMWFPYTTTLLTLVDVVNALDFVPGVFVDRGHDYRASIARMVSATYDLPVGDEEMDRIERALRNRERTWAEKRLLAEQMARAGEAVNRQLKSWGVDSSTANSVLSGASGMAGSVLSQRSSS